MTTTCPHCLSEAAVGTQAVSICTDCASLSVAGASIGWPTLVAATIGVVVLAVALRKARTLMVRQPQHAAVAA